MSKEKGLARFFVREKAKPEAEGRNPSASTPSKPVVKVRERDQAPADLLDAILSGQEIVTEIETAYGVFEYKYPSGEELLRISYRRAEFLGGFGDNAFDPVRKFQFEMWATLDVCVVKKPKEFEKMTSWANCPIPELVEEVYARGSRFCGEFRGKLRKPGPGKDDEGGEPAGA